MAGVLCRACLNGQRREHRENDRRQCLENHVARKSHELVRPSAAGGQRDATLTVRRPCLGNLMAHIAAREKRRHAVL